MLYDIASLFKHWLAIHVNCNLFGIGKLLPVHQYNSADIFHILVLQEYWFLMESRIPLQPVPGA